MTHPSSDRQLDPGLVSRLITDQFPDFRDRQARYLGAGWDHDLFVVGGDWVFRFSKRAERVPWLVREIGIIRIMNQTLGSLVPHFEYIGKPCDTFPYPFVGYRQLPGLGADQSPLRDPGGLAEDIGHLLSRIHRVDAHGIPPTPVG